MTTNKTKAPSEANEGHGLPPPLGQSTRPPPPLDQEKTRASAPKACRVLAAPMRCNRPTKAERWGQGRSARSRRGLENIWEANAAEAPEEAGGRPGPPSPTPSSTLITQLPPPIALRAHK